MPKSERYGNSEEEQLSQLRLCVCPGQHTAINALETKNSTFERRGKLWSWADMGSDPSPAPPHCQLGQFLLTACFLICKV